MDQPLILDRYRPLEDLASGGFGDVVLAYDTRMQRRVAIKRLPLPQSRFGPQTTPAGLAEARTAALLNHPAIVTVHEWDTDSDEAFIIMEFIEGPSLADILDAYEALDLDTVAAIVESVAAALEFAHENGVLHLDVKPENVLLCRDGSPKVADFGIAQLSTSSGHGRAVGGTIGYMPLEQLHGEALDERTDIWAFAALCFELLTNANPFAADSIEGAVFKAQIEDPPSPSEFESLLPPEVDDVLMVALSLHAFDRYVSVADFAHDLLSCLGDPVIGRENLAEFASELSGESEHTQADWEHIGLWDRLTRIGGLVRRLGAGLASAWLVWTGLGVFEFQTGALAGAAGLAALAGLLAPGLGTAIGLLAFVVGLAFAGFYAVAAVFAVVGGLMWWFVGREGAALSGALLTPALGIARLAPAGSLLIAYETSVLRATLLGAYAGGLTMLASAASGGRAPYLDVDWRFFVDPLATRVTAGGLRELLSTPAPLAVIAAWAAAAGMMSLLCRFASRGAAVGGGFLGMLALYGGYSLADVIARSLDASATWSGELLLPHLTASSILIVLVIAAGPPLRAEEE